MKAIGYIRVSTTNQDVTRQIAKYREFCTLKNFTNIKEISDFGVSGATFERKGFRELQSITLDDADIIVISELSRLSRKEDILDTLNSVQNITNKGLKLLFLDNPEKVYTGTLDLQEIITLTVSAYGAAQERLMIKRRNQEGKTVLFNKFPYAVVDGIIPFGYNKIINPDGNHPKYLLQEDESESKIIRKVFDLVIEGYSVGKITRYLFDLGFRNKKGKPFTKQYLSKIYSNPLYKGERLRKDKLVKIEPIVKPEIWDKAQILIKENYLYSSTGTTMFNPLKGIIRCRCGKAMTVKNKGEGILVYRCSESKPAYMKDKKRCSYMDSVRFNLTNEVIFSLLKKVDFLVYTDTIEAKIADLERQCEGLRKHIELDKKKITEINEEIPNLNERYINAKSQALADAVQEQILKKESEIKQLNSRIKKNTSKITITNEQIKNITKVAKTEDFDNLDLTARAALFKKYIKKINYLPVTTMQGFYVVDYFFGAKSVVAVKKTNRKPVFANVPIGIQLTDDLTLKVTELSNDSSDMVFNLGLARTKTITIQQFLESYASDLLEVNLSYRTQ